MFISPLDSKILGEYKKATRKLAKAEGSNIFEKYLNIQTRRHLNVLKTLSKQLHKIHKNKRIFILIPAFYENDNIAHTLDTLIPRNNRLLRFWCSKVLIVILNNFYDKQPNTHASHIVKKYKESRRFKDIHVINYALPHNKSNVGYCRKILHDLIIYNANRLTRKLEDCIFVSSDADILENDLRIFKKAYTLLLKQNKIDAAQGAMTRIPKYVNRNNLFCVYSLLYDGIRDEWQSKKYRKNGVPQINFMWNRVFTYGANLFLKTDVYCRVGGFDCFDVGEDYAMGAKISFLYVKPLFF